MVIVAETDVVIDSGGGVYQDKSVSYTPTGSQQTETITADSGYSALSSVEVTVDAMSSGTEGTPTATKGAVSNHSVSVTPSVTNSEGYISGGTKTGTPVTVSASELVSGSQTITENSTVDVTDLAEVVVNVSGSSTNPLIASGTFTGNGGYTIDVDVGDNVPLKNFLFLAELPSGTVTNDTTYKIVSYTYLYTGPGGFVKNGAYYYPTTGTGYTAGGTDLTYLGFVRTSVYVRNTGVDKYSAGLTGTDTQYRPQASATPKRIDLHLNTGNSNYKFINGATYNWKLYYFGSDYANESLSV